MNFDNLRLRTKTLIPLAIMIVLVAGLVSFGAFKLADVSSDASEIIENRDRAAVDTVRAARYVEQLGEAAFGGLIYDPDDENGRAAAESFKAAVETAPARLDEAMKLAPDKAADIAKFKSRFQTLVEAAKIPFDIGQALPPLKDGRKLTPEQLDKFAEGAAAMERVDKQLQALAKDITAFNLAFFDENAKAAADLRAQSHGALLAMVVVGAIATLVAAAIAVWISSAKIARPLVALGQRMRALASGDVSSEIQGQDRRDEIGDMAKAVVVFRDAAVNNARLEREAEERRAEAERERQRAAEAQKQAIDEERSLVATSIGVGLSKLADKDLTYRLSGNIPEAYRRLQSDFNSAIGQLEGVLRQVAGSTSAIRSGAQEITVAADDMSERTEKQAAALEETAAALKEITATVKKSADGASHAHQVVAEANSDAQKTSVVVRRAVVAMENIAKSAEQISQIIGVIDEIAFQTNLLALNAGVEAARAGDAGRGFAVVASEVRTLAQRSAEAAKEIKGLITASTTQVGEGVKLVAETGKSLERMLAQVGEINEIVTAIAAGAKEQANGLTEVNTAVSEMDQTTQQNASMAEQSTAASHSLSKEAGGLSSLVGQFRLGVIGEASGKSALRAVA